MPIRYFKEELKYNLKNKRIIKRWIIETIENENYICGDINIIFTSDNNILKIKTQFIKASHHKNHTLQMTLLHYDNHLKNKHVKSYVSKLLIRSKIQLHAFINF